MGRQLYFTTEEIQALYDTASEWMDIMGSGDELSVQAVNERVEEGLGSALEKITRGKNGHRVWEKYARH